MISAIDVKPCPFCGVNVVEHPNVNTGKEFFIIYHKTGCHFLMENSSNYTLLSKSKRNVESWNKRRDYEQ
jgi:hypothetical protein